RLVDLNLAPVRIDPDLSPRILYLARQSADGRVVVREVFPQCVCAPVRLPLPFRDRLAARFDCDGGTDRGDPVDLIDQQTVGEEVLLRISPGLTDGRLPHLRR